MKRKITKRKVSIQRQLSTKNSLAIFNPWALLLVIAIIMMLGTTIYFYSKPNNLTAVKNSFAKLSAWMEKHKHHHNGIIDDKMMINSQPEMKKVEKEQQVQFEFYSILPNMRVTLTENTDNSEINNHRNVSSDKRLPSFSIGNQEELEREISAHIQPLKKSKKRE